MKRAALALVLACSAAAQAATPYRAAVEVVLDASKGAAATAGGKSLWELQVAALTKALAAVPVPAGSDVLVRTIGGEPGLRCEASAPLVPAGVSALPVLQSEAAERKPQGLRALATAFEGAAGDLAGTAAVRSLVVLTTGNDACGRDACQVVRELRRDPGLGNVRVIGVGGEAPKGLACAGALSSARTAEELEARLREAFEAAFVPAEVAIEVLDGARAVMGEVEVFPTGDELPVSRGRAGATFALGGGLYDVKVSTVDADGALSREGWRRGVEVASATKVSLRVPLGKGPARLVVHVRLNGAEAPDGTRVFLHRPGERDNEVATGWPEDAIVAGPGKYDVRARIPGSAFGDIEVWKPATVLAAGETTEVTLEGRQKLGSIRAVAQSAGEPLEDAAITVLANGARGEGEASIVPGQEAWLPVGTYTISARFDSPAGPVMGWRDDVKITPDGLREVTVEIAPTGMLEVEVTGNPLGTLTVGLVRAGEGRPLGWIEPGAPYRLAAGKWDLRLESPGAVLNRVWYVRGVVVAPGETRKVSVPAR